MKEALGKQHTQTLRSRERWLSETQRTQLTTGGSSCFEGEQKLKGNKPAEMFGVGKRNDGVNPGLLLLLF